MHDIRRAGTTSASVRFWMFLHSCTNRNALWGQPTVHLLSVVLLFRGGHEPRHFLQFFPPSFHSCYVYDIRDTFTGPFLENVPNPFLNPLIPSSLQPLASFRDLLPTVY